MDDDENESLVRFQKPLPNPAKQSGTEIPLTTYDNLNLQSDSSDEDIEEIDPAVLLQE